MIYQNIEFFNIAEIHDGVLYRFPEIVGKNLGVPEFDTKGNFVRNYTGHLDSVRATYDAELRFRAKGPVKIVLETESEVHVTVYNGDFLNNHFYCAAGRKNGTGGERRKRAAAGRRAATRRREPITVMQHLKYGNQGSFGNLRALSKRRTAAAANI